MKKMILGAALVAALAAAACPAWAQTYGDVARVLSSTPIHERASTPRRECHTEPVTQYEERREIRRAPEEARSRESGGIGPGTILGAIVGGVIGHQFGGSSAGRDHGTVAGALIGGIAGNQADREADDSGYRTASRDVYVDRAPVTRDVERCDTVAESRERIVGYDVRYEYNGHEFRTRMPFDPGPQMPVNVDVRPPAANVPLTGPRPPAYRGTY
jgi:uncharacterized protein YcfJ